MMPRPRSSGFAIHHQVAKRGVRFSETGLRTKPGALQAQRLDDSLGDQFFPGFPTEAFQDSAGDDVTEIPKDKLAAVGMIERLRRDFLDHPITHFVHVALLQVGAINEIKECRYIGQSALMRKQLLKRN